MAELLRVMRAVATNQVARLAPKAYLRATQQTGRGVGDRESPEEIADYFRQCVDDYLDFAGVAPDQRPAYFEGQVIVEYGPGDFPGVALLLLAMGARKVYCVDRFPMVRLSEKNIGVLKAMLGSCTPNQQQRIRALLIDPSRPVSGFRDDAIEYLVRPHGFSDLSGEADLVISRAVLEHVDDLEGTFADMVRALKPGAHAWHQVDLRSHGLHRSNPLDFLGWSPWLWSLMYSCKGVPNRWRIDRYRDLLSRLPVGAARFVATRQAAPDDVKAVRSALALPFRAVSDDDLAVLGFWMGFCKPTGKDAPAA